MYGFVVNILAIFRYLVILIHGGNGQDPMLISSYVAYNSQLNFVNSLLLSLTDFKS